MYTLAFILHIRILILSATSCWKSSDVKWPKRVKRKKGTELGSRLPKPELRGADDLSGRVEVDVDEEDVPGGRKRSIPIIFSRSKRTFRLAPCISEAGITCIKQKVIKTNKKSVTTASSEPTYFLYPGRACI